ncbi:LuxR C-terminal-related transcriptional regulator [Salmonella enterica]|nr:hypothetical protein [Salmonella enterica subsp. enterica serovar Lexington]EDW0192065.1 hypothetical protein [Salmonella enterica subsp. enterica serovar Orion]EDX9183564.1 hypothetical protein [Salmonella enterica subsp. enterica serovar Lexington]EGZ4290812.1 hypothetical protein [Salmonella enterica subsp. enterica serovar Lexington]ELP2100983.1 hypothetical protein [Salmonella enterica subsp. enterica serovar Lexington]
MHIFQKQDICQHQHKNAVVIIDTLMNNILHSPLSDCIITLKPKRIIILSPFGIKRLYSVERVIFISRNIHPKEFCRVLLERKVIGSPTIYFTKKQHQILTLLMRMKNIRHIAEEIDITQKTLASHQYNIMLLLNLRQFSRLLTHPFANYLRNIDN